MRALAVASEYYGPQHIETANVQVGYAVSLTQSDDLAEAQKLLLEALAVSFVRCDGVAVLFITAWPCRAEPAHTIPPGVPQGASGGPPGCWHGPPSARRGISLGGAARKSLAAIERGKVCGNFCRRPLDGIFTRHTWCREWRKVASLFLIPSIEIIRCRPCRFASAL